MERLESSKCCTENCTVKPKLETILKRSEIQMQEQDLHLGFCFEPQKNKIPLVLS